MMWLLNQWWVPALIGLGISISNRSKGWICFWIGFILGAIGHK
jgi:hypothetical protein